MDFPPVDAAFKNIERKYRYRKASPDVELNDIIDFRDAEKWKKKGQIKEVQCKVSVDNEIDIKDLAAYSFLGDEHEGFYVIPNFLDKGQQLELAHEALTSFAEAPYCTNLDDRTNTKMFEARGCKNNEDVAASKDGLRWATMGYHYDWTNRKYNKNSYTSLPKSIAYLAIRAAKLFGMEIKPQAAIVNYYKYDSRMGGHQDDVEEALNAPVISMSIGMPAIFLKGSVTKSTEPKACILRSGDLVVMGRKSRLSVHAVPRVLVEDKCSKMELKSHPHYQISEYLQETRININIRQVYV